MWTEVNCSSKDCEQEYENFSVHCPSHSVEGYKACRISSQPLRTTGHKGPHSCRAMVITEEKEKIDFK
jgi:hypothetical protein